MSETDSSLIETRIEALVDRALAASRKSQASRHELEAALTDRRKLQAIAVMRTLLESELGADLVTALGISIAAPRSRSGGSDTVEAVFSFAGLDWRLTPDPATHLLTGGWRWSICAFSAFSQGSGGQMREWQAQADPMTLCSVLLVQLGERRERLRKLAEEAAERAERQRLFDEEQRRKDEEQRRERAARIQAADDEDARLRAELAAKKQEAERALWRWPEGVAVTLYRLTFLTAAFRDADGEVVIEQEAGWTATDRLDDQGYIRLEPHKSYSWSVPTRPREVKLDPAVHLPTWERQTFGCVEDLPEDLRETVTVSLPLVVERRARDLDGTARLVQVEEYGVEETVYEERVGEAPLLWVRTLVEQAAAAL